MSEKFGEKLNQPQKVSQRQKLAAMSAKKSELLTDKKARRTDLKDTLPKWARKEADEKLVMNLRDKNYLRLEKDFKGLKHLEKINIAAIITRAGEGPSGCVPEDIYSNYDVSGLVNRVREFFKGKPLPAFSIVKHEGTDSDGDFLSLIVSYEEGDVTVSFNARLNKRDEPDDYDYRKEFEPGFEQDLLKIAKKVEVHIPKRISGMQYVIYDENDNTKKKYGSHLKIGPENIRFYGPYIRALNKLSSEAAMSYGSLLRRLEIDGRTMSRADAKSYLGDEWLKRFFNSFYGKENSAAVKFLSVKLGGMLREIIRRPEK